MSALLLALILGCSGDAPPRSTAPAAPPRAHAAADAVPGTERVVETGWPPTDLSPDSCAERPCTMMKPCLMDGGYVCLQGSACTRDNVSPDDAASCACVTVEHPSSAECHCGCFAPEPAPAEPAEPAAPTPGG